MPKTELQEEIAAGVAAYRARLSAITSREFPDHLRDAIDALNRADESLDSEEKKIAFRLTVAAWLIEKPSKFGKRKTE